MRFAVFVSGSGTNLQNFLDLESQQLTKQKVVAVVADQECFAIERAKKNGKPVLVFSGKLKDSELKIFEFLKEKQVEAILLLGFMKILPASFIQQWKADLVNLHPSLLPKHKGLHAIEAAYKAGDLELGASLHRVTEGVDEGPLLSQKAISRNAAWTLEEATEKVHALERELVRDYLFDLDRKSVSD